MVYVVTKLTFKVHLTVTDVNDNICDDYVKRFRFSPPCFIFIIVHKFEFADFTSVNSFQDDLKFTSPSFYNLTPPPPPTSRPPGYDVQNYQTTTNTQNGTIPAENYYAATDIIKVRDMNIYPLKFIITYCVKPILNYKQREMVICSFG